MKIEITKMQVDNFKGIKNLTVTFDGNMDVFGDNATGKTTIVDAFLFGLFDKNSNNDSKFSWKPIMANGEEIHNLETKVELTLNVNGEEKVFTKIVKELWTQKRGSTEKEFSGHTSEYYVDGTPKTLAEYKKAVAELAEEEVLKMITNLYYFNTMDWKKRREIVMKLAGDISDEDVIASVPSLKALAKELAKKSVNDVLDTAKVTKTKINKALSDVPTRIDELKKVKYEAIADLKKENVQKELDIAIKEQTELMQKQTMNDSTSAVLKINNEILRLKNEKVSLEGFKSTKHERLEEIANRGRILKTQRMDLQDSIRSNETKLSNTDVANRELEKRIETLTIQRDNLYKFYDEENAKKFVSENCSYCGQPLPKDKLEELEKQFNLTKASKLEAIVKEGKEIVEKIKDAEKQIKDNKQSIETLNEIIVELKEQEASLTKQINEVAAEFIKVNAEVEVNPNQERIKHIDDEIEVLENQKRDLETNKTTPHSERLSELASIIMDLNHKIALFGIKEQNDIRVQELVSDEKRLTSEYEKYDNLQKLCEEFITTKANLLQTRVNMAFEIVEFKLFDKQINGGISETCVATVNGVPFGDLNHAMQVNAGLDIIQALQKVYNVQAPIFVDNAESITKYKEMDSQLIRLYVSEMDKTLRFESYDKGGM